MGAIIPAKSSCVVTLTVSGAKAGSYTNSIAANALATGPAGGNTVAATATLTVTAPIAPTIAQSFSPTQVGENTHSTLTLTLGNTNAYALTRAALADTLPSNLSLVTSPAASSTCAGSLSTAAGTARLAGGTIPANGSCTISLTVSSGTAGTYTNTLPAQALTTAQNANNSAASSATLTVTAPSGGGGALNVLDLIFAAGILWVHQHVRRRPNGLPA